MPESQTALFESQDTSTQNRNDLDKELSLDSIVTRLVITFFGFLCLVNSLLVDFFFEKSTAISSASSLIGALVLAIPVFGMAIRDIRKGNLSINELVSLALLATFAQGDYLTAGLVAFFMLLAELILNRTAVGARASIASLIQLTPDSALKVLKDGKTEEIKTRDLSAGDIIRVKPGDNIPADGEVIKGESAVNQATITGESLPVDKNVGDEVFAGTSNLNGVLEIMVSQVAEQTTIGKVRDLIMKAEQTKLPIMRIIDQYMGYYTPLVLVISALVWLFTKDMERVISVMVVLCPVAFVLATPSAMVAALSAASRLGILIKNVADLEAAGRINSFIFDKTGTLTTGELAVQRLVPVGDMQPAELLFLAGSAESYSNHPTAKALLKLAEEAQVDLHEPQDFKEVTGKGVTAKVGGHQMSVGRGKWLQETGVHFNIEDVVDLDETEGFSLIFVARDGQLIGWMGLRDQTRELASDALVQLDELKIKKIAMVTGDREPVAKRVAKEIGCTEVSADCLPQDKVEFVNKVKAQGYRIAVVGDGVNDAPALAAGDLGIAMGAAGSEVAINSATIALMNNELNRLPFLVKLSRTTRKVINQNFLLGLIFILGGLVLAALGYLNPVIAAILQNAGSLLVVFNSARLVRQGEELEVEESKKSQVAPVS